MRPERDWPFDSKSTKSWELIPEGDPMKNYSKFVFAVVMGVSVMLGGRLEQAGAQNTYYVRNMLTNQVLDLPGGITSGPIAIQQFVFKAGANQQWIFSPAMGGCRFGGPGFVPAVD